jgi:hypothetical protein
MKSSSGNGLPGATNSEHGLAVGGIGLGVVVAEQLARPGRIRRGLGCWRQIKFRLVERFPGCHRPTLFAVGYERCAERFPELQLPRLADLTITKLDPVFCHYPQCNPANS